MPIGDVGGVAVDDVDHVLVDADHLGDHLREGGLVALAVAVAAGDHDRDRRWRSPGPWRSRRARRGRRAGRRGSTARCRRPRCSRSTPRPRSLPLPRALRPARLEAGAGRRSPSACPSSPGSCRCRRRPRPGSGRGTGRAGRSCAGGSRSGRCPISRAALSITPLELEGRLGPAGAAIGVDRHGVGEDRLARSRRSAASCSCPAISVPCS